MVACIYLPVLLFIEEFCSKDLVLCQLLLEVVEFVASKPGNFTSISFLLIFFYLFVFSVL